MLVFTKNIFCQFIDHHLEIPTLSSVTLSLSLILTNKNDCPAGYMYEKDSHVVNYQGLVNIFSLLSHQPGSCIQT